MKGLFGYLCIRLFEKRPRTTHPQYAADRLSQANALATMHSGVHALREQFQ